MRALRLGGLTVASVLEMLDVPMPLQRLLPHATPAAIDAGSPWMAPRFARWRYEFVD